MKSDTILIDNQGNGFSAAVEETKRIASYNGLDHKQTLRLQLITEEMLSLARSVTGEMKASFWIESEGSHYDLHMDTKTVMDKMKRSQLLSAASSRKNEAARGFLGRLRDAFEQAMLSDAVEEYCQLPTDLWADLSHANLQTTEWDGYERSILRSVADDVKISIRGGVVDMTVSKTFVM